MARYKTVAIRTDSSNDIGSGHIMRCLTIANALKNRGYECVFICRSLLANQQVLIKSLNHKLVQLSESKNPAPDNDRSYQGWLGTTQDYDAKETINALTDLDKLTFNIELIIVDHYSLDKVWEDACKKALNVPIFAIDDLDREHVSDILLDTTFGKTNENYPNLVSDDCNLLIGAEYALLRPDFNEYRQKSLERLDGRFAETYGKLRILIFMGGVDAHNATEWVLKGINSLSSEQDIEIVVLVGGSYRHAASLQSTISNSPIHVELIKDASYVAKLLSGIDLCIGASGSSTWERCCLGVPTINLVLAENQSDIAMILKKAGITHDAGIYSPKNDSKKWALSHVKPLLEHESERKSMSMKARAITDGLGVLKVLSEIFKLTVDVDSIMLRKATEKDTKLLFDWQQHPNTRKYARDTSHPTWENHISWMTNRLSDNANPFYIIEADGVPAGMLRLDACGTLLELSAQFRQENDLREISILTAPEFYGRGVAKRSIQLIQKKMRCDYIVATVHEQNLASNLLFQSANFFKIGKERYIWPAL